MDEHSVEFLKRLLNTPGPSGFEAAVARVWREEAATFADRVEADVSGNSMATLGNNGALRVMLAGHIDEIGLMVTHIDDDGFLYVDGIGGWDAQVLVGQRVLLLCKDGGVRGVIGKKPVHAQKNEEKEKASKLSDLWVDVGIKGRDAVLRKGVRVGDPAVIDAEAVDLSDGLIASRAVDNRIGAFVVLEALRLLSQDRPTAQVTAVATAQEEISYHGGGASTSAFQVEPHVALVVDVTFATDYPCMDKKELGDHKLGGGPVLTRGSAVHPLVFERLVSVAEREAIPYTITASPRFTSTDADAIYLSRAGVPTGLVSIPNRYMHSPNEIISLQDLENGARLIASFVRELGLDTDFVPR
ncbi:MAG: M42 family metallopeptidase [Gemmatimonadetes bacterium]|nr:M42 family metallopeptidase [Gemmatimonadota bacterium]